MTLQLSRSPVRRARKPAVGSALGCAALASAAFAAALTTGCPGGAGGDAVAPEAIAAGSTLAAIQERGVLRVGMEPTFPPFEYKTESGELIGLDVDLMRALAEALDVEVEFVEATFDGVLANLLGGNVDVACSGVSLTLERAKTYAFSEPYYNTGLCLLIRKGSDIESHEDLNREGVTLAVKLATTGFIYAKQHFPNATLKVFDEEGACALEVAQGRADAFVYDQYSIRRHHRSYPQATRVNLEPFTREPYAIMIRQGDPDFARYLDTFIRTLEREGRLEALRQAHLGDSR